MYDIQNINMTAQR